MPDEKPQTISFAEFELDASRRILRRAGKPIAMNAKTFDLLAFLAENSGRVVTKNEILDAVWEGHFVEEANLSVQISALRKALGEKKDAPRFLVTVPGKGYKFVGEIERDEDEIVIERHKFSRVVIEEEERETEKEGEKGRKGEGEKKISCRKSPFLPFSLSKTLIAGLLLAAVASLGLYLYFRAAVNRLPFERVKFTRLTNSGKVSAVTLSPDGKFIAYVLREGEGNSLWVRQTGAANDTRILPPVNAKFWSLTFTPDATEIYYNLFTGDQTDAELFRIPTLGGVSQKIPKVIAFAITFAPDGKRFAYVQPDSAAGKNYLVTANADGTDQRAISEKTQPETFVFDGDFTAWSPDGETIACLVNHLEANENYQTLIGVNARDGSEKPLSSRKWRDIRSFEWLRDNSGLLVSGGEKNGAKNQIWVVSTASDEIRAVTDDFNSYSSLGVGASEASFIALENSETNSIAVGEVTAGTADNFQEIVSEVSALDPLAWTPDGKIIYRSYAGGESNFWSIDANGANRRQLTAGAQVDDRGMCVSPDGNFIFFVSWRSGKSNLWRVGVDGKNLRQLTDGEADAYPVCMPDNRTIVFQRGILSQPRLWTISTNGGEARQLADFSAKWGAVSPDGRRLSYLYMKDGQWRIGFLDPSGQPFAPDIAVPVNFRNYKIEWSADNKILYFIGTQGNTGNVWTLANGDAGTKPFTNLKNYALTDFAFSADRQKLALARSVRLSDVVLVTEVK